VARKRTGKNGSKQRKERRCRREATSDPLQAGGRRLDLTSCRSSSRPQQQQPQHQQWRGEGPTAPVISILEIRNLSIGGAQVGEWGRRGLQGRLLEDLDGEGARVLERRRAGIRKENPGRRSLPEAPRQGKMPARGAPGEIPLPRAAEERGGEEERLRALLSAKTAP
jgi:hypothetical protein